VAALEAGKDMQKGRSEGLINYDSIDEDHGSVEENPKERKKKKYE
jgi:hypothetical protein